MRLRQAKKILKNVDRFHDSGKVGIALRRYSRTRTAKEADALWNELAPKLRRQMFPPLTDAEIEKELDKAEAVPLSEERIREIVDYCLSAPESN